MISNLTQIKFKNSLKYSIIRRSILFLILVFFGFSLNYMLQYFSSRILEKESFGIFYESIIIINIATLPSIVMGMYFSRYVAKQNNKESKVVEFINYINIYKKLGAIFVIFSSVTLFMLNFLFEIKTALLLLIIILTIYSNYLTESLRTVFEASNRIIYTGFFTLSMLLIRFLFGITFLLIGGNVWSGILGIMVAGYITFFLFYYSNNLRIKAKILPKFKIEFKNIHMFMSAFLLVSITMYIDIILAYFVLSPQELSVYSASSVLPKGLLLFTLPLTKVLYPIIANKNDHNFTNAKSGVVIKMMSMMFFIAAIGVSVMLLFSDVFTEGLLAIKHSDISIFTKIALSIIPLTLLRSLVSVSSARGNDREPLFISIPLLIYVFYAILSAKNLDQFTNDFVIFSFVITIYYLLLHFGFIYYKKNIFNRGQ